MSQIPSGFIEKLDAAMRGAGLSLAVALNSPEFVLFEHQDHFIFAQIREIAGRRLTILASFPDESDIENNKCLLSVFKYGRAQRCVLLQFILPASTKLCFSAGGFYIANFLFKIDPNNVKASPTGLTPIIDSNFFSEIGPAFEYKVRWDMPGSTWPYSDVYQEIVQDYRDLHEAAMIHSLCKDGDSRAFILWLENATSRRAIVAMIHVNTGLRGKGLGAELLRGAAYKMAENGIKEARYVVSAHNFLAIRMLQSAGWKCAGLIVNRQMM